MHYATHVDTANNMNADTSYYQWASCQPNSHSCLENDKNSNQQCELSIIFQRTW
jgi:hypothetical protein